MRLCPEKLQLLAEYNQAISNYTKSITSWIEAIRSEASRPALQKLQVDTEDARLEFAAARARLNRHVSEHRC